jgi:hypothetical protein
MVYDTTEIVPHTKGRSAGLNQSVDLLLTAVLIETVAYFYHGQFMPIGLTMFISIVLSFILIQKVMQKRWV